MRNYLANKAPWWLVLLVYGGLFFVLSLIGRVLAPSFFADKTLAAGISSVLFGVVMTALTVGPRPRGRRGSEPTDQD